MFRLSTITRFAAAIVLSAATVIATLVHPAEVASASPLHPAVQSLPLTTGAFGEDTQNTNKTDLVVLFQKVEKIFNGYEWTYTVANATSNTAHHVVVTKGFKIVQTGTPKALAAPMTENLGSVAPYEVRWITIVCGNSTPEKQCVGTSLSAKTSTPEVISTNNSASHSFK
jgi:hypothetical protein